MTRTARIIAAPRWRHFVPQGESFNIKVPFYESSRDPKGELIVTERFRFDFVAGEIETRDFTRYQLPPNAVAKSFESITVSYDGVLQDNESVLIHYNSQVGQIWGPRTFFVDGSNRVCFQRYEESYYDSSGNLSRRVVYNKAPAPGTQVRIDIVNDLNTDNLYVRVPIRKIWLIQGANPIDPNIIDLDGFGVDQFQGGYRCVPTLISRAEHGHVRMAADKLAFEYRPDMGYLGVDSFAYRMVNALGQESPAYCVRVDVGTNQLPITKYE